MATSVDEVDTVVWPNLSVQTLNWHIKETLRQFLAAAALASTENYVSWMDISLTTDCEVNNNVAHMNTFRLNE